MLEIYNEAVQDLLVEPEQRKTGGLQIRQSKTLGVYVQDLSKHPVDSYEAIERKIDHGTSNRSVGSTQMNKTSSRAHTIITIEFHQFQMIEGNTTDKFSVINLVDLAGSERQKKTKATKGRLKEGCAINLSLSSLGNVINVLADQAIGKGKDKVVPYRASALTRILQNALGGNSKTIMVCAISPANINYEESLNTLRYAERAKKVKNVAMVNESAQDKKIRQLSEENDKLKNLLSAASQGGTLDLEMLKQLGFDIGGIASSATPQEAGKKEIEELKEQMADNEAALETINKPFQERLQEEKERMVLNQDDRTIPHLTNLNEDSQLTNKLYYDLSQGPVKVGTKKGDPKPEIVLGGVGIQPNHAVFSLEEDVFRLMSGCPEAHGSIFINGNELEQDGHELIHNDRIIIGNTSVFIFKNPPLVLNAHKEKLRAELSEDLEEEEKEAKLKEIEEIEEFDDGSKLLDWEYAQKEKMEIYDAIRKQEMEKREQEKEEEQRKKFEDMQIKAEEERRAAEEAMKEQEKEFLAQLEEMKTRMMQEKEEQLKQEMEETERLMIEQMNKMQQDKEERQRQQEKEIEKEKDLLKQRQVQSEKITVELDSLSYKLEEANLCAKEFGKNIHFSQKLITVIPDDIVKDPLENMDQRKMVVHVRVQNKDTGEETFWDVEKFNDRLLAIRDMYSQYLEEQSVPEVEEDAFFDEPEPQLIGQGYYKLQPLAYVIDNPHTVQLISSGEKAAKNGKLEMNIMPTDESGWGEFPDERIPLEPEDMVGERLDFAVVISKAIDLPENFCKDVYCEYSFFLDDQPYQTPMIPGKHQNPVFEYRYHHTVQSVSENLVRYLKQNALCIKVFGYPSLENEEQDTEESFTIKQDLSTATQEDSLTISKEEPMEIKEAISPIPKQELPTKPKPQDFTIKQIPKDPVSEAAQASDD